MSDGEIDPALQAALDAWEDWKAKKAKSDRTMAFLDCGDTAQAWVRFQNLFLGDNNLLGVLPKSTSNPSSSGSAARQ